MKIIEKNGLRILTPNTGYRIVNKERTQVYDGVVYLGKLDTMYNYVELTDSEAEQLRIELENKQNEE